ncbi:MAG TPA: LacI family DNA-binding transcriptional regulator, partial [Virgibacillus sp.]|nr:LacI family DNA-binding transcriptional regulator [Virgibacillus sp.]
MTLANRKEVAKLANVSEATVSRVFNNVEPLRESTKQKVFQAAKQLNYQPNVLAKKFATGKSGQIGVVVPYLPKVHLLSTYYFSEI